MNRRNSTAAQVLFSLALPLLTGFAGAQETCAPGQPQLVIVHAGSVSAAFAAVEARYTQQTGVCVVDIAGGSVSAARKIASGRQPCDIFASADDAVIDRMLKPAGLADFSIRFAQGHMVLAYTADSKGADGITPASSEFKPPGAVPEVAADWASRLLQPGVTIGGSHPFLDPGGYRADLIFQLAQDRYPLPGLYNDLLGRYVVSRSGDVLGQRFDYQFTYAHSALAATKADRTGRYRYARLPAGLDLGGDGDVGRIGRRGITIPGLQMPGSAPFVAIPARRVTWGLTVMKAASNRQHALGFLQLLFSPQGVDIQSATGPQPISPPRAGRDDHARLPEALKSLVLVTESETP
jgi:ABC-type molybdate transport system substrate-binding protein